MAEPEVPIVDKLNCQELPMLRDLRFGVRAFILGWALSYALVLPLKWFDMMPDHLTWLGLVLAPAALFGPPISLFAGYLWLGRRWWVLFTPVSFLALTILIALNIMRLNR
jgi:hypothetical protein